MFMGWHCHDCYLSNESVPSYDERYNANFDKAGGVGSHRGGVNEMFELIVEFSS